MTERIIGWARENPPLAALTAAFAIVALVLTVLTVAMARSGASLRPILWFAGFFAIVAGPQAVVHLLDGLRLRRDVTTKAAAAAPASQVKAGPSALQPVTWDVVFGPDADPALITDAKRGLAAILESATEAKLSFYNSGESALAARFPSRAAAVQALEGYGNFFVLRSAEGSHEQGWTARRHGGQGEWVHVVTAGPELYAWTGASRERVLHRRTQALGPLAGSETAGPANSKTGELVSDRLRNNVPLMLAIVGVNLVAAGFWFFKGSAWAARVEGSAAVRPIGAETLRQRLLTLNGKDVPTTVADLPDKSLEITWRYADARWFDLMRLHQMRRMHRLVLHFDERSHTVRVREYWSAFDASADPRNLRLNWKKASGIQFFAFEQKRVIGAQLGPDGTPTGALSQAYTFDLQALKAPVVAAVTESGWRWQPVTWNAPAGLRWLTE